MNRRGTRKWAQVSSSRLVLAVDNVHEELVVIRGILDLIRHDGIGTGYHTFHEWELVVIEPP